MSIGALGRLVDISTGIATVDLNTAGATGKRVSLKNASACLVVVHLAAAASGTESVVGTLKQYTASTGGTTSNLASIDKYWIKAATALAGSETWTRINQTASQTLTIADTQGALTGVAQKQAIVAFEVDANSLADGNAYIGFDLADPGAVSRLGSVLYLLHDLTVQRAPVNLAAPLS